jgi:membrane protein CcdC involved in cytochrome C biogenesis
MHAAAIVGSIVGGAALIAWRMQETRRPVSLRKILLPPLVMSTGLTMFLYPPMHIPLTWALLSLLTGALVFSYPLRRTSTLTISGDQILLKRSRAFLWILLGLVAVRFALRSYVGEFVTPPQTGALFFLLMFGMILRWRLSMLAEYRELRAQLALRASGQPDANLEG